MDEMDRMRMKLALAYVKAARQAYRDYDDEVDEWYRNGDGRSTSEGGRGYRFPYCIHGRALWVDHDIPCGLCELDGSGFDYMRELASARDQADHDVSLYESRFKLFNEARRMGMPGITWGEVIDWVFEPIRLRKDVTL